MKRGVLLLILVFSLLSACTSRTSDISYQRIVSEAFMKQLIEQNAILKKNISYLNNQLSSHQKDINLLTEQLSRYYSSPVERAGPYDRIKGENIVVKDDKIIIELKNATIVSISDTHSLEPLIHKDTNVIEIMPKNIDDIHLGDLVSYKSEYVNGTILHRVVSIGFDDEGWYSILKGDNNPLPDPGKIRFEQIRRVVVGVIY